MRIVWDIPRVHRAKDAVDRFYGGRYLDECLRRDGEWRISKRTYILDWVSESSVAFVNLPKESVRSII